VTNSAHEQLRGSQVEFDKGRLQIKIKQNVADLQLPMLRAMYDTVNAFPLWGMPPRCVKLSDAPWEKKYYGQCYAYYQRTLTFDVRRETFDKDLLDEGTKVLKGHWNKTGGWVLDLIDPDNPNSLPDPNDPTHFIKATDTKGNAMKVVLNGQGLPAETTVGNANLYISINGGNVGNDLSDETWWIEIEPDPADWGNAWDSTLAYEVGALVTSTEDGELYLCFNETEFGDPDPSLDGQHWILMPNFPAGGGDYDPLTTYDLADYVKDQTGTHEGIVHVEKYDESDFTLLNIPLDF
jgi:hypothetical protein